MMFSTTLLRLCPVVSRAPQSCKSMPSMLRSLSTASSVHSTERQRVAIVTGAARGIGRAIAFRLANDGYDLAINDLPSNQIQLEGVSSEIVEQIGRRAIVIPGDVSVEEEVQALVARSVDDLGGVDVVSPYPLRISLHIATSLLETPGFCMSHSVGLIA